MKKTLLKSMLAIVGLLMSMSVNAAGFTAENGLAYTILETTDGTNAVEVTYTNSKGGSYTGDIVVPATVTDSDVTYTVTGIGEKAFYKCTGMTSISLPEGLLSIGRNAFYGCTAITACTIPSTVTEILNYAFQNCKALEAVVIPYGVEVINTYSFNTCEALKSLTIGAGVKEINSSAFKYCEALTEVTIPKNVEKIADDAFGYCKSLTAFVVDAENATYCAVDGMLYSKDKTTAIMCPVALSGAITVPAGTTTIGDNAFNGCTAITSVTLPSSVTAIGESAFDGCSALTTVNLAEGLKTIGESAFDNAGITSIAIPNSVTSIAANAFGYCMSLETVTIGSGLTTIGEPLFYRCTALKSITVDAGNTAFASVDGVLFSKDLTTLIAYPNKKGATYAIPEGVLTIGSYAFCYCTDVTAVTMPNTVTALNKQAFSDCAVLETFNFSTALQSIGEKAFYYCEALKTVELPEGLVFIGEMAFNKATTITDVVIPNSVVTVDDKAFQNCTALKNVTLGSGITSMGGSAFNGCSKVEKINILLKAVPETGSGAFNKVPSTVVVTMPTASISDFAGVTAWNNLIKNKPSVAVSAEEGVAVSYSVGIETEKHAIADGNSLFIVSGDPVTLYAECEDGIVVKYNDEEVSLNENNAYAIESLESDGTFAVTKVEVPEPVKVTPAAGTANPFAYGLKSEYADNKLTVTYSLNADAADVWVAVKNADGEAVAVNFDGETTKGTHSVELAIPTNLPDGTYTWDVEVYGAGKESMEEFANPQFYHPRGVDVDNNMESENFGNVYVTEGILTTSATYWSGNGGGNGLYIFTPDMEGVKNSVTGKYAFMGGFTADHKVAAGSITSGADLARVRVAEDGRIFVTRCNDSGAYIAVVNSQADLVANDKYTDLLGAGTLDTESYAFNNAAGEFVAGPNVAFDIKGSGEDLTIIALSSQFKSWSYNEAGVRTDEYALGTAEVLPAPTAVPVLTGAYTIAPTGTSIDYDDKGGIWYCQYRGTPNDTNPALMYINAAGEIEYFEGEGGLVRGGGAIRVSPDGTQIAIPSSKSTFSIYDIQYKNNGSVKLVENTVVTHGIGTNVNDIAWDLAGNIYICGNSGEYLKGFSLPRSASESFTTKAASKYAFELASSAIEEVGADANAPVEYYNLQGVKVTNPENGVFIKKQGNKATKVVL